MSSIVRNNTHAAEGVLYEVNYPTRARVKCSFCLSVSTIYGCSRHHLNLDTSVQHVQNICLCALASVCLGFVVATEYENEGKKETSVFQTSSYHIERIPGFVVIGPYSRWLFWLFSCNFGLSFFLLSLVVVTR